MRDAESAGEGATHREADTRWAAVAFGLSAFSALVYFAASVGIRNFVAFLVDGVVRFAHLFGLSA